MLAFLNLMSGLPQPPHSMSSGSLETPVGLQLGSSPEPPPSHLATVYYISTNQIKSRISAGSTAATELGEERNIFSPLCSLTSPFICSPSVPSDCRCSSGCSNPQEKKITALNEIFMCGCLSIRVKQISALSSSGWEGDHVSDVTSYHRAPQSSF